ncbi:MAG TPA: hypothetical protein VF190_10985, partial [Rhodothermales bacterium]
ETFDVPLSEDVSGTLTVRARLLYRKIDQFLLNTLFGPNSGFTAPVTEIAAAEKRIVVSSGSSAGAVSIRHVAQTSAP